ncbi:MerR family transcriptional regulator [Rhodococcus tibetensis]|uniref:MerR family transcriptional regulator n=1 Tax=Rhodococcus tibetensis TaxID=2965064 RepID=A0ABT1Q9T6_9NOCA|nr:MerR family transcriptional regulator [Rhodococcus sp. FXJ9.536]MCQ4118485.1 MerR family transcriptional regulator [Rhodococcus sp. FXJ9.536]
MDGYTVGELARLSGVSVRTLHHYDSIGLLRPHRRSAANHRLYSPDDVQRLRHILFYRELEFGLDDISEILAEPHARVDDHLRRQHRLLRQRQARTEELLEAIQKEMHARRMGVALSPEEQLDIFNTDSFGERLHDVEHRWAESDQNPDLHRRTVAYTKDDWVTIKAEADANIQEFVDAIAADEPATGTVAMQAAENHRAHIARWFFECSHRQHRQVAALYISDPVAAAEWNEMAPGFAQYVHDAILANAAHADGSS